MKSERIYLDHNALSPLRPEVRETLLSAISDPYLNPSSIHGSGRRARRRVDEAREDVAKLLGVQPSEIIFTSGGTESVRLAWNPFMKPKTRIVTSAVEHACVLGAAKLAEEAGAHVEKIAVDASGALVTEDVRTHLNSNANLFSIQQANNETGIVLPIQDIAKATRANGITFHTDAVQGVGKLPMNLGDLSVDLLSLSGHKLGAPPGVGALYVRRGAPFSSLWTGGSQEKGRRTGTENVLGIIGLGVAARIVRETQHSEMARLETLRDSFESKLVEKISDVSVTGKKLARLPNTSHVIFEGLDGESLLIALDLEGIDCSTGAACSSGSLKPSHVLLAMGMTPQRAQGSIRFSLGWKTTEKDIDETLSILPRLVEQVRKVGEHYKARAV